MKAGNRTRFDIDALQKFAGQKVFKRGEDYFHADQVQILAIEPNRVLAEVEGSEDYRVELTGRGKKIGGTCSCPAFEDWGFCKHMVATALAANAAGGDAEVEGAATLSRIRDFLKKSGADALVEMIMGVAERDQVLFRKLDMEAVAVHADDKTLAARLRKAIDAAARTGGYIDYRKVAAWEAGIDSVLDRLASLAAGKRAALALGLAEHAIERIEASVESVDDSDGQCGTLLQRARDIHLAAAGAVRPDPVQLARDLFAREMKEEYDTFSAAAELYADVLGEPGLAEYRRLAAEAWDKLPPLKVRARERSKLPGGYLRLKDILDFFAVREGDVDFRIALRRADLSCPWNYLELADFCRAQGRKDEALRYAEEGLWIFEDGRPDERLVFFAADLLSKAGRKADAEAHLWRAFEKEASLDLYGRLRKLGGEAARDRAVTFLNTLLGKDDRKRWYNFADLLIRVLMREKMVEAAWAVARQHAVSLTVKEDLARASEATHPREVLETYAMRVDQLANAGGDPGYAAAVKFISRSAALRNAAAQAAYIAALRVRHGRKRNFMKLLA